MKKRNILFAIADDASHFGCYGHEFVKTPNIDKIASEGCVFDNAFTCNPKCAPSRASILTGKYSFELKDSMNHYCTFEAGCKFIPDYLDEKGYKTGFTGKGWSPGDYSTNYARNPAGNEYSSCNDVCIEGTKISSCNYYSNFVNFMHECGDKPFFFWFGCFEPHRPYQFGEGHGDARKVKVPTYLPDCQSVRQDYLDYANEIEWFDSQLGKMICHLKEIGEYDNTLIIITSDNGCAFPRIKGQIYEQDCKLPLVVRCPSSPHKKTNLPQIINFVDLMPTILDFAGIEFNGSGNSFLPLMKGESYHENEYAYFAREKHDNGRENDVGYPVRALRNAKYLLVYNFEPTRYPAGNPQTGFTNCDSSPTKEEVLRLNENGQHYYYNLAFGFRQQVELYDIISDEQCLNNLSDKQEYSQVKAELLTKLMATLIEKNDPRIMIDKHYYDKLPLLTDGSSYSWQAYKLGKFKKQPF